LRHFADDRLFLLLQGLQLLMDGGDTRLVEAGTDPAGITQLPARFVIYPEQEGAKPAAATLGCGKANDHELLALLAFELDPVGTAAGHIGTAGPLADYAFQGHGTGAAEDGYIIRIKGLGKAQQLALILCQRFLE